MKKQRQNNPVETKTLKRIWKASGILWFLILCVGVFLYSMHTPLEPLMLAAYIFLSMLVAILLGLITVVLTIALFKWDI